MPISCRLKRIPLDCKEIQRVHPKGNQSWVFTGRTDAEAETPIPWPPHAKSWLTGKDPDAGKDWRWEIVGWHQQHDGLEFEQAPGVGDGQGSLVCCSPWSRRVGHNWVTELKHTWVNRMNSYLQLASMDTWPFSSVFLLPSPPALSLRDFTFYF